MTSLARALENHYDVVSAYCERVLNRGILIVQVHQFRNCSTGFWFISACKLETLEMLFVLIIKCSLQLYRYSFNMLFIMD